MAASRELVNEEEDRLQSGLNDTDKDFKLYMQKETSLNN